MSELQERIRRLITVLEHMRTRPGMYIPSYPRNSQALNTYLAGLSFGCDLAGIDLLITEQVLNAHGWRWGNLPVSNQMEERGYSIDKIIDEVLLMHIETLKRRYDIPDTEHKQD